VVEPQDYESYCGHYGRENVLRLPESNRGAGYVRAFIKSICYKSGDLYHWQFDDNIKSFRKRVNGKNIPADVIDLINEIEATVLKYKNIGAAAMRYTSFAFSQKHQYSLNQQVCSAMLISNNTLDCNFREGVREDTDFSLQLLSRGHCTMIFNRLLIEKAKTMTVKGGCTDSDYKGAGRMKILYKLQEFWPGVFEIRNVDGVASMKPSRIWQSFKQKPIPV
jgi:hypothetical protein